MRASGRPSASGADRRRPRASIGGWGAARTTGADFFLAAHRSRRLVGRAEARADMIDFEFTDEHRLLEQTVRTWAGREIAPRIAELDRAHTFDPGILPQMADLGLLGISVPADYAGAGTDYLSLGLASEELEYVDTSLRVILSVHVGLNSLSLLAWGTEDQKRRYLVPQAQGQKIATFGLTEPAAGSDARGIQSVAVRKGDRYILNGEKMWISLADVADHFLVIVWTDPAKKQARDTSGLSAFIVERGFKGFSSGTLTHKWGILAGNTGYFKMDDVEVPVENLLGREGEGFKIAMFALDQGRYTVAAGATGLIRACRDASVKYARERRTFGVEIGEHQLVKEMIARMEADYQTSRLLWMRSGWLKNTGRRNTRETSLAKWVSTVASERAASDAVQIHGANGYSDEYPVGRFYRNCKGAVIYEGTREIHTIMQADYVLGYREDRPTRCALPPCDAEPGEA
jgi:glutaryl-CoA dehydrogenase (non-decarboxylating)